MGQFISQETLAPFYPPQSRVNFAGIQFNKVKETPVEAGGAAEMEIGGKTAGKVAMRASVSIGDGRSGARRPRQPPYIAA